MSDLRLFRMCAPQYAGSPQEMLNGEGAHRFGGRWNSAGNRVVYLSETLSLAAFEILVHATEQNLLDPYRFLEVHIPESLVMALDDSVLPAKWVDCFNYKLQEIGDAWIASDESLGLSVPSAVIPGERNVIIRPDHPDFQHVKTEQIKPFNFDPRIKK